MDEHCHQRATCFENDGRTQVAETGVESSEIDKPLSIHPYTICHLISEAGHGRSTGDRRSVLTF
jgi:hypothetical protein